MGRAGIPLGSREELENTCINAPWSTFNRAENVDSEGMLERLILIHSGHVLG